MSHVATTFGRKERAFFEQRFLELTRKWGLDNCHARPAGYAQMLHRFLPTNSPVLRHYSLQSLGSVSVSRGCLHGLKGVNLLDDCNQKKTQWDTSSVRKLSDKVCGEKLVYLVCAHGHFK